MIRYLNPNLSRMKASCLLAHKVLNKNLDVLTKPVIAQQTTTKRLSNTIPQHYNWNVTYSDVLDELRKNNMGVCRKSGKTFGEVISHFIVGCDYS